MKWAINHMPKSDCSKTLSLMDRDNAEIVLNFHKSFPQYQETPLVELDNMAKKLGLGKIYIKDESYRFGLNAFKVLGGSFAMAKYIASKLNKDIKDLGYNEFVGDEIKKELGDVTFFTATDGNHGRGVAWSANKLNQKSVVFMPKGSAQTRLNNIRAEGAEATIVDMNYDDAVRLATEESKKVKNGVVIQDTAWEGYEEIPAWIMQGYGTMALEANNQLKAMGEKPTHVFVQAGVGSLAGAVQGFFTNFYKDNPPIVVVVEAEIAACLYKSAAAGDGNIHNVGGDLKTIMAGLACGEANTISFEILKDNTYAFLAAPDWVSSKGMRMLTSPLRGDQRVISGESGAAPFGALAAIMQYDEYADLRKELKLDENSKVLLFSTEGDTDPEVYESIVWDGAYPNE